MTFIVKLIAEWLVAIIILFVVYVLLKHGSGDDDGDNGDYPLGKS